MNSENILKKEDNVIFANDNNMEKKVTGEDNSDGDDVDVDVDVVGDSNDGNVNKENKLILSTKFINSKIMCCR